MSAMHDSAMNNVYHQVLTRLLSFFSRAERTALQLLIQRLLVAAGGPERMEHFKVLLAHSGTQDSCYSLALLRAAQLSIAARSPATFHLRVATLRMGTTTPAIMDSIHRSYAALFVYDDPRVEVLMVDNREVLPFSHLSALSDAGREWNRYSLLLLGHLRDPASPYEACDDGYLATGEFYGQMSRWQGGVDALVGGATARQQRQFLAGLARAAQRARLPALAEPALSMDGLLSSLEHLDNDCYRELYAEQKTVAWRPQAGFDARRGTTFIDIQDLVTGNAPERWLLLNEFFGLQAEEAEVSLRENDYASALLSAHCRGLQASYLEGQPYERGVAQYVQRGLLLMRKRGVPEPVCQEVSALYDNPLALAEQRTAANAELQQSLGLCETQVVCLLFAPFVGQGAGLERFLRRCHPGMLVAMGDLHKALQGEAAPEQVMHWMVDVSGLPINLMRALYRRSPVREAGAPASNSGALVHALNALSARP